MDKLDELVSKFSYWNNRGKSAICRYILEQLDITEKQFTEYLHDWSERKLVLSKDSKKGFFFEVIIAPIHNF